AAYQKIIAFRPELPDGWMGICRLRMLEKNFTEAQKICDKYLARYPEYGLSNQLVAEVSFFSGNYSKARHLYENLATIEPDGGAAGYGGVTYATVLATLMQIAGDSISAQSLLSQSLTKELTALGLTANDSDKL